ncbi:MAG: polysaccharide biosynthesis tyrosine autokinase [Fibrobacteraceae bacterium]
MVSTSKTAAKSSENDFSELMKDLWKEKLIVLLFLVISGFAGVFVALWTRPVYEVNALLQVESKNKGGISALMGDLGSLFMQGSPAETEIELIKSRKVIGKAVEDCGLQNITEPIGVFARLFHKEGRLDLQTLEIPYDVIPEEDLGTDWLVRALDDSLHYELLDAKKKRVLLGEVGKSAETLYAGRPVKIGVIRMKAHKNELFAVKKIQRLDAISAFESAFSVEEQGKKTGILEFTYQNLYPDRGAQILNEIANAYLRQNVEQRSAEAQKTLSFLENQVPMVKSRLDSSEAKLNSYRYRAGSVDITTETRLVLENRMKLQGQILSLQQQRQEAARLFHEDHPAIKTLDEQIDNVKKELAGASSETKKLPETQQEILRLTSDVEMDKLLYTNLVNNVQQLRLVSAGEVGSVRIVDYAEPTTRPVKPNRKMIIIVALFFGFCAAVLAISIKKKFHNGVRDSRSIEREIGVSVFAKIPKMAQTSLSKSHQPVAVSFPDDVSIEALRTLRSSLEFSLPEGTHSIIAISGLIPAVGKSFISVNLAVLFAETGKKVLLIDADLRKGRLHREFGLHRTNYGLADVLMEKVPVEEGIHLTEVAGLSLMPAGQIPGSPAELLGSSRYLRLVENFKKAYDIIIVDTPPIMLVTDAMLACRSADAAVMVVEYNRHSMDAIREGLELFTKGAGESLQKSIVINKYVHSGGDGYGYKYGKY